MQVVLVVIRCWSLLLASEGDESGQGTGERLEDCKCDLHGKHLYGMLAACNERYLILWFLWLFEAIIITSLMDVALITVFLVVFAERKKAPNLISEWGFKGPHCKFKFEKETSSSGIPCSLHLGNTDLYLWLLSF